MVLQTLGALRLGDSEFSRPKPLLLLAYLSLEGSKARRYLADLFFMDTADPLNSLSRALSYLRTEGSVTVQADEQKVWTTLSCDAAEFINHADQKRFDKALELYQGPFLESLDLPLGSELEEWVYGTREYLAGRFRNVLLQLAEQEASKGNLSQATRHAERAYTLTSAPELEPDDIQRLYRFLQAGKSTLASKLKQEAEDFDIDLSSADLALPEVRETIRHNLPIRATSFVGRDLELVEIARQLANPDIRLLTLHGTGGIGKSRLAVQAAYDQLQQARGYNPLFTDGIFFVPLDALASVDLIPASIAEALGLELQGQDDTLSQAIRFIGQKHLLLILDNYEHLMAGATLPSKLLSACANLKLLVTSRERLNVEEEWVMTLEGLPVPDKDIRTFEEAQRFDALGLFIQRAKRARLDFTLSQDDLPHALKICQLVEGSPLGIELAAVWVKMMPLAEIAKEIESNLSFLTTTSRNVPHRHQSIEAAFEHSWKLLTEKEQEVLRKLSVFVGGFRREAAAEVAGATLPILASLVDKSLLVRSVDGRYSFHFLISQLLTQKLSVYPHERDLTEEEHVRYFLTFLDEFDSPQKQADLMNIIEIEIANFRQAWLWSLNNLEVIALRTLLHLMTFFERRARFQEGLLFFSSPKNWEVFEHTSELQDVLGSILLNRAWLHYRLGQLSEVQKLVEKGMDMLFPNNYLGMINGLNLRGLVNHSFGNYDDARRYFSETIQIARAYSVEKAIPSGLNNLAQVETTLGNFASAKTYYLEALSLYEKSRNKFGIVATLKNLGELNLKIKQYQEAKHNLIRGLKIAKEVKHEIYMPEILNCLALVSFELNKYEEALHLTEEALKYAKISGDPHLEARVSISFGRISLKLNDAFQAARYFRHAIEISWLHKNIPLALQGLIDLAELLISLDKIDQAKNILRITLNHSSIDFDSRSKANNLLVQIDSTMSTNQFSLGTTASFSFEQEVEQLLQEPFV